MQDCEFGQLRNALVDQLIDDGYIRTPEIEQAFRTVPRHLFVPEVEPEKVYSDSSIPTKFENGILVSSSSQPAIMAIMLEQLQVEPGHRVLEIGAGTGYNAGLLRYLVGNTGLVVSIDIDEDIVEAARDHLAAAGMGDVTVLCADGGRGYADHALYDRIILTVGTWDIAPAWFDQLKPGGLLVLPLDLKAGVQKSIAFRKMDDRLESVSVFDCGFMTLRGDFARPKDADPVVTIAAELGVRAMLPDGEKIRADDVYELLSLPYTDVSVGVTASPAEVIFGSLSLWLALREPGLCGITAQGDPDGVVPCFLVYPGGQNLYGTIGLLNGDNLCLFVNPPDTDGQKNDIIQSIELYVRYYGYTSELVDQLVSQVKAWDAAGRPGSDRLYVSAYPKEAGIAVLGGEFLIPKHRTDLVLRWE